MYGRLIALLLASLLAGSAALIYLLLPARESAAGEVEELLATVGAAIDLSGDAEVLRAERSEGRLRSALVGIGEDRLRIRVSEELDSAAAEALVNESRALIENLFADRQAPYPGQLSHTLRCPERYLPVEVAPRGPALAMLRLFANSRLAFGGCSDDLLRYSATVAFFYDETAGRLFRAEYFSAKENPVDPGADLLRTFRAGARVAGS